jgi:hypothetical protein
MSSFRPRFLRSAAVACLAGLAAAACAPDRAFSPKKEIPNYVGEVGRLPYDEAWGGWSVGQTSSSRAGLVQCTLREAVRDSAVIGADGGTLIIGQNRLIVPAGALTEPTLITGTVPAENVASIRFEPSGLTFQRPAGLVMDVTGCEVPDPSAVPDVNYLDAAGEIIERINARFAPLWHTIAAPIDHFSQYAIAV